MKPHSYSWDSRDYLEHSSAQYEWGLDLIDKLKLRGSESVLDTGCGDGKVTALIRARLTDGRATGIDSSDNMVSCARSSYPPEDDERWLPQTGLE
jgi:trans-aconitate methyltransferase